MVALRAGDAHLNIVEGTARGNGPCTCANGIGAVANGSDPVRAGALIGAAEGVQSDVRAVGGRQVLSFGERGLLFGEREFSATERGFFAPGRGLLFDKRGLLRLGYPRDGIPGVRGGILVGGILVVLDEIRIRSGWRSSGRGIRGSISVHR